MKSSDRILQRTLVWEFYRRNAGFFLFFFICCFGVIAPSQQPAYHYSLIQGMLKIPLFLVAVLLAWLLYAIKCHHWVVTNLLSPESAYLNMLSRLDKKRSFLLLLRIQLILYLPVSAYALAVTGIALYNRQYGIALLVQFYIICLCLVAAAQYRHRLYHPGTGFSSLFSRLPSPTRHSSPPYWSFFIRYFFQENKALLLGIKISGCSLLYLLLRDREPDHYDVRLAFLLYSMVLFGHGVLIYRCRELEDKRLLFYMGMPVSWLFRFGQMAWLYFLVLAPEMCMIAWLTPVYLRWKDAFGWGTSGYALLLLLNSILYTAHVKMSDFLKLNLGIFGILYLGVLGDALWLLAGLFFVLAVCLFFFAPISSLRQPGLQNQAYRQE